MTDKTPLQQLAEWQELSNFFHSTHRKELICPENTLTLVVDSYEDVLMGNCILGAKCKINGEEIVKEETFCVWDDHDGTLAIKTVEKMMASLANRITQGLVEETCRVLLTQPNYDGLGQMVKDGLISRARQ
jgi:hypothetical protein